MAIAQTADHVLSENRRVLVWHWGKEGAGAKFTGALARGLRDMPGTELAVSAATSSDLARDISDSTDLPLQSVKTFEGNKATWSGKLAAGFGLLGLPRIGAEFSGALAEFGPDVALCAFQSIWDLAALPVLRRAASRFVLVLHDAEPHPGDRYLMRGKVLGWEVQTADALIALSAHVASEAQRIYGFPADRIYTVPHGAFTFGDPVTEPRAYPNGRPFRILFFGRILAYKGLGLLIEAYRLLREQGFSIELFIVGSGDVSPYRDALQGLDGISLQNGWVDDDTIAKALLHADAVVLPYIEASQSGVATASFSAALPVIATPVGGLVEQVEDGLTGLIADSVTAEALARSIAQLATSAEIYEACSAGALRHAQVTLDWRVIAKRVSGIIDDVVKRPRRGCAE
jgi:glycosyltransferase involved in cell wall biosynthesis